MYFVSLWKSWGGVGLGLGGTLRGELHPDIITGALLCWSHFSHLWNSMLYVWASDPFLPFVLTEGMDVEENCFEAYWNVGREGRWKRGDS